MRSRHVFGWAAKLSAGRRSSVRRCYREEPLAGDVLGGNGWHFRLGRAAGTHFVAGGFEINVERIKCSHGHLGAPSFHLSLRPAPVESDGPGNVFRKQIAVIAFANEIGRASW